MIERPLIILGVPRSGTTILFRCLAQHPDLWHLRGESHGVLEGPFHPANFGYESNRVTGGDVDEATLQHVREMFYQKAINLNRIIAKPGWLWTDSSLPYHIRSRTAMNLVGALSRRQKPTSIRLLEKTPKNTLRVSLLHRMFPDAYFLAIQRQPETNIDSLIAGWFDVEKIGPYTRPRFGMAGYSIMHQLQLQDYTGERWKFALVPEWRNLRGKTVADVAAWQYYQCNYWMMHDLAAVDPNNIFHTTYEDFTADPKSVLMRILTWAKLQPDQAVDAYVEKFPRVVTAAPRAARDASGLRYGNAVRAAIQRLPTLDLPQPENKPE